MYLFVDPCTTFVVHRATEGWCRLQPPSMEGRKPITFDLCCIHRVLRDICWSKYECCLFSVAYAIAFFAALRVGEIVNEGEPGVSFRGLLLVDRNLSPSELVICI